jgi:threonyl-tRNA synthetase
MNLPERFDLTYVAEGGEKKRPIMLHRALFGSIERFIGIIIEHYAGAFPLWLAPKQMVIIPVSNEVHAEYAKKVEALLKEKGIRVTIDDREEKMNYKIRESQTKKVPYTLVLGDNEAQNNLITYRHHGTNNSVTLTIDEFINQVVKEVETKGKE